VTDTAPLARLSGSLDPAWLAAQRWYAGKGRTLERTELAAGIEVGRESGLLLVDARFDDGETERYAVPIGEGIWPALLARLARGAGDGFELDWRDGELPSRGERELGRDQSNTTYALDERLALKCYRRLWPGPHPEVELVGYLSGRSPLVPPLRGALSYRDAEGTVWPVALVQDLVPDAEDGWAWGQARLADALARRDVTVRETGWARPLGRQLAELQLALCGLDSRVATADDAGSVRTAAAAQLEDVLALVDPGTAASLERLAPRIREELDRLCRLEGRPLARVHGDLHVGQVLDSPAGFHVIDFEGEPTRPPAERRALRSPLRDVASMLRSFEHLARWHLRDDSDPHRLALALEWVEAVRSALLAGYSDGADGSELIVDPVLVRAFEIEKETYELVYAARFLPEWTPVALASMHALLAFSEPS